MESSEQTLPDIQYPSVPRFLGHMVFENSGLRVGLELSLCVILYGVILAAFPWNNFEALAPSRPLFAWFMACGLVAVIDYIFLGRSVRLYRKVLECELNGYYEKALRLLDEIGPRSQSIIRCPLSLYHFRRSQILGHAKQLKDAEAELLQAARAGLDVLDHFLGRAELLKTSREFDQARVELSAAQVILGVHPVLKLEEAFLALAERKSLREVKRAFESVLALPDAFHGDGETTHALASSFWEASRLWTGEAEEGLEGLNEAIANIRVSCNYIETLRPMASELLLERAYYLTTHREPTAALRDLRDALALCSFPRILQRAEEIRDEHNRRYPKSS